MPSGIDSNLLRTLFKLIVTFVRTAFLAFATLMGVGLIIAFAGGAASYLFGSYVVAGIGSALISIGSQFVLWTGSIFNYFVENLVAKYSITLQGLGIMGGIDTVWAAFRDVANIALIGLFVFIAINIILGVKSFGEKKTIARVLIIAVLLNFSLLFTKIIIDVANFTAYQFYKSAGLPEGAGATSGGVADAFLSAAGITTIGDTASGLKALADSNGTATALGFSLVAIFLLLVMVGLFIYGAFQVIARSIFLVFLMVVSPLAFVSWLVPANKVEMTWGKWWQSLVSAAFFAPLFMMSLWASMILLQSVSTKRGDATLGQFFTSAAGNTDAWAVIFVYCFAVGLLYASIKFASTFSHSIAGYGYAASVAGLPFLSAFALGNRALRITGRQTFGKAGVQAGESLQQLAKYSKRGSWRQWTLDKAATSFKDFGKRDFDAMATKFGTSAAMGSRLQGAFGGANVPLAGKALGGFEGVQKKLLEETKKFAARNTLSDDEKQKERGSGIQAQIDTDSGSKRKFDTAKKRAENAEENLRKTEAAANKRMAAASADIAKHGGPGGDRAKYDAAKEVLGFEGERIKKAREAATAASVILHDTVADIEKLAKASGKISPAVDVSKSDIAKANIEKSWSALLFKATGQTSESLKKLAEKAEKDSDGPTKKSSTMRDKTVLDIVKDMAADKKRAAVREKRSLGVPVGDEGAAAAPPAADKH